MHENGLRLEQVVAGYDRKVPVVRGLSLEVSFGETVVVLGANGSGKSTVLKTVFGLTNVHSGEIYFNDERIKGRQPFELVRRGLGMVPQSAAVFPSLEVRENLAVGAVGHSRAEVSRRLVGVLHALPQLERLMGTAAGALSGGEQRLVAVGRALMADPKMLLLDEITAGLSPKAGVAVLRAMAEVRNAMGLGLLMVEQNARTGVDVADRVLVVSAGRLAFEGSRTEAIDDSDLASVYLGGSR